MLGNQYVVEFTNVSYVNKGDCLMLLAIQSKLLDQFPRCIFVTRRRHLDSEILSRYNLKIIPRFSESGRLAPLRRVLNRVCDLRIYRDIENLFSPQVHRSDVDAIFDVCGYNYHTPARAEQAVLDARMFSKARADGKKVILMPKTFGPFDGAASGQAAALAAAVGEIISSADMVFARDAQSLEELRQLGSGGHVQLMPDYTSAVGGKIRPEHEVFRGRVGIIPNNQMVARLPGSSQEAYIEFLRGVIDDLRAVGIDPYVLMHDHGADRLLAAELSARDPALDIVDEADPVYLKGLIGSSRAIFSSRLHGLINGLSQGVPSVALGWVHKYEELMSEYGVVDLLVSPPFDEARTKVVDILTRLMRSQDDDADVRRRLKEHGDKIVAKNEVMWSQIRDLLGEASPA